MTGWRQPRPAPQKFPRLATCVPVRVSTVDPEIDPDSGASFFRSSAATTGNLSRGGVFVHSWEPLAAGRRVIVALDLPAGGELQMVGQVVWTRRKLTPRIGEPVEAPGYGIEFAGGSRAEQAAIQQILDAPTVPPAEGPGATTASPGQSSRGRFSSAP
jgi:Tfp pilus assembly protein PilZ